MSKVEPAKNPNQIWHVISRGVRRSPLYFGDEDRREFLGLLDYSTRKWGIRVPALCLMDNHNHFLMQGLRRNISRCMNWADAKYARNFNSRAGTTGHLFQDNFKAFPARSDYWAFRRLLYIHMNPVVAGMVSAPEQFPWSSAPLLAGGPKLLKNLDPWPILKPLGHTRKLQLARYSMFLQDHREGMLSVNAESHRVSRIWRPRRRVSFELLRTQVDEAQALITAVESAVMETPRISNRRDVIDYMIAHLSIEWLGISSTLMGHILGCKANRIREHRRTARRILARDERLGALLIQIRNRFEGALRSFGGLPQPAV